jgi:catalase
MDRLINFLINQAARNRLVEPPLRISGDVDRFNHREGNDFFGQLRALVNPFDEAQMARLYTNIAATMGEIPDEIQEWQCKLFDQVHPDYGAGVRHAKATIKDCNPSISAPTDLTLADASA